jgi:uncharacterized protein (DUF2147 family)
VIQHVQNRAIKKNLQPLCLVFAVGLITASTVLAQPARVSVPDPTGEWLVAKQLARIKIVDCDGRLWGVVAWEAEPGIDSKNPNPSLRTRPTLGMPILLGMQQSKTNRWDGQIYNSQDGHTYSANISLVDPITLRVQGCFLGFLCGGENWTRFDPQEPQASAPTQNTQTVPPKQTTQATPPAQKTPPKPPAKTASSSQPDPANEVCSKVLAPAGLPHERGLK